MKEKNKEKTKPKKNANKKTKPAKEKKPKTKIKPDKYKQKKKKIKSKTKQKFAGRFGSKFKRKKSKEKWSKWRYPRGQDIQFKREYGAIVKPGYRSDKKIRGLHPSGFKEKIVYNAEDLKKINNKDTAARIASATGKKKRMEIRKKAKKLNIRILN